jgi:FeS assembly SUF system regulator
MIKLGKLTDYAVVIMAQLSREGEGVSCSAAMLAGRTAVPEPTVAKIMKQLAREGLVDSARGAAGGYRLARPADDISIADIITCMDGPVAIVSCIEDSGESCKTGGSCAVKGRWTRVNDAIRAALTSVKLTEMAGTASAPQVIATIKMPRQERACQ